MKRELKRLILIYLIFVLVKIILAYFIPSSRALADDYQYLKMSESFFYHFSLRVHDTFSGQLHPLYPIIISIAQVFRDNDFIYLAIKFINSLISSLIIFPAYFISKEFLSEKKSLLAGVFTSLLPANFALMSYIMSENLFYSLFLTSIFFIYMAFNYKRNRDYFLAAFFILLTILTRIHGFVLVGLIIILALIELIKKRFNLKYLILISVIFISFLFFVIYARNVIYGLYTTEALGLITGKRLLAFIVKYISYFGFLLIGSGFILMLPLFFSFSIKKINNLILFRKISVITIAISLFIVANHAVNSQKFFYSIDGLVLTSGRVVGRYIDFCLPLIMILGFIGLDYYFKNKTKIENGLIKKFTILLILIMFISSTIILSPLVPFNNVSLTLFGLLKYGIDITLYSKTSFDYGSNLLTYLIISLIFVLITVLGYYAIKKFNYKKFLSILLLIILLNSFISLGVVYYAAKTSWYYNSEQRELALFLNEIDKKRSLVLIDKRDFGDLGGFATFNDKALYAGNEKNKYTIIGYWLNDELIIGDVNKIKVDYVISTYELNLEKLYETSNGIFLYKAR